MVVQGIQPLSKAIADRMTVFRLNDTAVLLVRIRGT